VNFLIVSSTIDLLNTSSVTSPANFKTFYKLNLFKRLYLILDLKIWLTSTFDSCFIKLYVSSRPMAFISTIVKFEPFLANKIAAALPFIIK